ncbi:MAG: AAC(3) family N-acetyltransferase [Anaerolineae bacterium]|jgi:aminoglycoside 3-N-acetyltransferase|nr:AAC(3) family N-acetyltransferase [Anaerolineae bacterium]MBT7071817.1 AAC(3) family N-acetyltransferase [Anaerolineae bacterium]MBT7324770.1 AAC(3) family N-acetyltransferase [Anaerolineae bacterium]
MLTHTQLVDNFRAIGVDSGDTLLVHSSYKSFGGVDGGPQTVIDALLDVLGADGTLVMPTFNFDFCKGADWDVRETPSQMGFMTNLVRQDARATRVFHPIYSFAVIGKHAQAFGALRDKSSYGANSAFAKLRELDGKIMVVGLSYNDSMTFFHHVEEMEGVDYRYLKDFTGNITDWEGNTSVDTYQMLVRDLDMGVQTMVDPMGYRLEEEGIIKSRMIGEADVKLMKANEVYDFTVIEMKRAPFLLYQIEE